MNFKQCDTSNFQTGRTSVIKYIVIHYTANNGDTAKNNVDYFANNKGIGASAHYFVDEKEIWQSVECGDAAWHCGGTSKYKHPLCRNQNSIGVEMCSRKDSSGNYYFKDETVTNTIALTRELMKKYSVPIENVIRHYDVWAKTCPAPFVNNPKLWDDFKNRLIGADAKVEELKKLQEQVNALVEELEKLKGLLHPRYGYVDENMPQWARDEIKLLQDSGILKGDETGNLQLSDEKLWTAVLCGRVLGRTLKSQGHE